MIFGIIVLSAGAMSTVSSGWFWVVNPTQILKDVAPLYGKVCHERYELAQYPLEALPGRVVLSGT
jgi:hypothetical protein